MLNAFSILIKRLEKSVKMGDCYGKGYYRNWLGLNCVTHPSNSLLSSFFYGLKST